MPARRIVEVTGSDAGNGGSFSQGEARGGKEYLVKKILIGAVVLTLMTASGALAAPKGDPGPPAHGCEQANENDGDPYDSTCDGSPSENGKGEGNATGKPCAGCVGAADNKNPPGQMPNGSDPNNGYECDGNQGVGKTNPAHTGCDAYSETAKTESTKVNGSKSGYTGPESESESGPTGGLLLIGLFMLLIVAATSRFVRGLVRG